MKIYVQWRAGTSVESHYWSTSSCIFPREKKVKKKKKLGIISEIECSSRQTRESRPPYVGREVLVLRCAQGASRSRFFE